MRQLRQSPASENMPNMALSAPPVSSGSAVLGIDMTGYLVRSTGVQKGLAWREQGGLEKVFQSRNAS